MKESGGSMRGFKADKDGWGFIDVSEIGIKDGADLTPTMEYIQPDDGNPDDQTVMKVVLPAPLKPGESVVLAVAFTVKLPKVFARAGFAGDFFMAGQWFPKIGVLWKGAWNCHQYHAQSEFFADFGSYRVDHHRAREVCGRGDRQAGRGAQERGRQPDLRLRPGRCPRLRLDGLPRLRREPRALPAGRTGRGHRDDPPRPQAPPRARATATRGRSARAWSSTAAATALSLSDDHPGRSGARRATGAGGMEYPDPFHGRDPPLHARRRAHARDGHHPRVRPRLLVWHRRLERVRGGLAGRGHQHLLRDQGHGPLLRLGRFAPVDLGPVRIDDLSYQRLRSSARAASTPS